MDRKTYRNCAVPRCKNTSITTPNKIFIDVPRKVKQRKMWFEIAGRNFDNLSTSTPIYFCEDHFDLPNDMENYMRYHIMGFVSRVMLKPGCLPSKFDCQTDRKRSLSPESLRCPAAAKTQRLDVKQKAVQESEFKNNMETENPLLLLNVEIKVEEECSPPETEGDSSKSIETDIKSRDVATSSWLAISASTSPFKTDKETDKHVTVIAQSVSNIKKEIMEKSNSDTSDYTSFQPLPSVQNKLSSETSKLNEEAQLEKGAEAKQALIYLIKKIEAKPLLYIGITKESYFLINMIKTHTNIPSEHILLCLKRIRLNTTFEELSDEFNISPSYAVKIFLKNIPAIANILKPFIAQLDKKNAKSFTIASSHRFIKVSSIIDCFEIEIEKPSKAMHRTLKKSKYKKENTFKYLISSTPKGLVNYISPGFAGGITDTSLVEKCDFLEHTEPGSWVLANFGFKNIEQLFIQRKCHLLRPPITQPKLTKQEVHTTQQIANLRNHIERVIRRIREFIMLKPYSVSNSKLVRVLDDCVLIACALINLRD